jgi:hypothetical protein
MSSSKKKSPWFRQNDYLSSKIALIKSYYRIPAGSTVLIHIGKCGGSSLRHGIEEEKKAPPFHIVHIRKVPYRKDLKYIIVARGPIARLISAFRWRYKLVVTDGTQKHRFRGEYEVLTRYGSLNNIAESLYHENGTINKTTRTELRKILHIREDISFYLHDLLMQCDPNQITAVLMQETLNEDILRVFGYKNSLIKNINPAEEDEKALSDTAMANLKRFFIRDYEALTILYCWGKISRDAYIKAI